MATKKQRRTDEVKHKKTQKKRRFLLLSAINVASVVFLAIFFITLFDYIYPPATGKYTAAKKRDKQEVTLFFSDANERFLVPEKRFIPKEKEPEEQAQEMVKALLAGSKTGLVNTFPEKAELQGVKRGVGSRPPGRGRLCASIQRRQRFWDRSQSPRQNCRTTSGVRISSPGRSLRLVFSWPARSRKPLAWSHANSARHCPGQPTTAITPSSGCSSRLK